MSSAHLAKTAGPDSELHRAAHARNAPEALAPRPVSLEEIGVRAELVGDLVCKHLHESGDLDLGRLAARLALTGSVVEEVVAFLRAEGRVEVRGRSVDTPFLRFALTDRGRAGALDALLRDGYVGPAPVPLEDYRRVVLAQSVNRARTYRERVHAAFSDTVIRPSLLDQLGPAVHSGRAVFVYGPPGTGKSFIARRLNRLLSDAVLIPHAILVGDSVIRVLEPGLHRPVQEQAGGIAVKLTEGHDPRFVLCERPLVFAGGELTLDMLELQFDAVTRRYLAPLQLKATNGMLLIDDLGRQRLAPVDLFNRWIVPLEEHQDYLNLRAGQHFSVPFDVVLVLSTNLNPLELADEAFLRRIGYKIRFAPMDRGEYERVWRQVGEENGVAVEPAIVRFVVEKLHVPNRVPLLPCHPRDLLGLALDYLTYNGERELSEQALEWAWENYFIRLAGEETEK